MMKWKVDNNGELQAQGNIRLRNWFRRWKWVVIQCVLGVGYNFLRWGLGVKSRALLLIILVQWVILGWQVRSTFAWKGISITLSQDAFRLGDVIKTREDLGVPLSYLIYRKEVFDGHITLWIFPFLRSRYRSINKLKLIGLKGLIRIKLIK